MGMLKKIAAVVGFAAAVVGLYDFFASPDSRISTSVMYYVQAVSGDERETADAGDVLEDIISDALDGVFDLLEAAVGDPVGVAGTAVEGAGDVLEGTVDVAEDALGGTVGVAEAVVDGAGEVLEGTVGVVEAAVDGDVNGALEGTVDVAEDALEGTVGVAEAVVEGTGEVIKGTGEVIKDTFDAVKIFD